MKSGKTSIDGASIRSDDRNSAGSYGANALRSFVNMLPFNFGFGSDTNNSSRADFAADNNEIL